MKQALYVFLACLLGLVLVLLPGTLYVVWLWLKRRFRR